MYQIMMVKLNGCIFLIEDYDLMDKYNTVCDKVSADIKKEINSKPVYNKKILKTKIKSNSDEGTDFYDIEIPKVGPNDSDEEQIKAKYQDVF